MMLFSPADGSWWMMNSAFITEVRIHHVSMARAKLDDILEYIRGCPEEQCSE